MMISFIKKFVLKKLNKAGFFLIRKQASGGSELNPLYFVAAALYKQDCGHLVQIGANDGITNDPVRKFILDFTIPSLLVEPQPNIFKKLEASYRGIKHVTLKNCAIDNVNGKRSLFYIDVNEVDYPSWASEIASFDLKTILKHKSALPAIEKHIKEMIVNTYAYDELLKMNGVKDVFVLQIDVEGYDYELLKHIVSIGILPRIIQYEHKHLSYNHQQSCRQMLADCGYAFLTNQTDTIAVSLR